MTAKILRLEHPMQAPTTLGRHLTGHHAQGVAAGGVLQRMQSVSAARAHVRGMARRHPLSDSGGREDVWALVEDLIGLVPSLATGVAELEDLANALRMTLSLRSRTRLAHATLTMRSCTAEVVALGGVLRMRLHSSGGTRVITAALQGDRARRVDDATSRT